MPKSKKKTLCLVLLLIITIGLSYYGGSYLYRLKNPNTIKPFQDPFLFNNGTRVATLEDWEFRRTEIKEIMLSIEYGHMPGRPDALQVTQISENSIENNGTFHLFNFTIIPNNSTPHLSINFTVFLYIPDGIGPFPVIIEVGLHGNSTHPPFNGVMLQKGYIYAGYGHKQLDPDTEGYDVVGPCQAAYPTYDWGSLAVWAWGAMRVVDYLVSEPWVQSSGGFPAVKEDQIIMTGHSRAGKTALLAAALDERIDVAAPNGSGCGGAGSFLVQGFGIETIAIITSDYTYKAWFKADFNRYGGKEKDLPFDQHFMRALIAPRLIISTDGLGDYWANPMGTHAVYLAAQPVFDFMNVSKNNAIHFREGGHDFLQEDFEIIIAFSDLMLNQIENGSNFYNTPYNFRVRIPYSSP